MQREALTYKDEYEHIFINIWYINELVFCQRKNKVYRINAVARALCAGRVRLYVTPDILW